MHTSEGLELESETSPAGLVLATWPIAGVWVRGVANRAGRDLLWHPQDIARAPPSSLRAAVPPIQTGEQNVPLPPSRHHNIQRIWEAES